MRHMFISFLCEINQGANQESAEFRPIRDKIEAAKLYYLKNTTGGNEIKVTKMIGRQQNYMLVILMIWRQRNYILVDIMTGRQ